MFNGYTYQIVGIFTLTLGQLRKNTVQILKENMHNSESLWKSLKFLLPSKLKSVAKSFIINDVLETNPKNIPTAFIDLFYQYW